MNKIRSLLVLTVALVAFTPGCQNQKLEPAGVYQEDKILYNADQAIANAYDVMHAFVLFEYQNREALISKPEIRREADKIRVNAQTWVKSAVAARDIYARNPTTANRTQLSTTTATLEAAIKTSKDYQAKGLK